MATHVERIVIVGASVAGLSAADTLREEGYDGSLVVLSAEAVLPYDRPPLSKQALDPRAATRDFLLRPEGHYDETRIDLRLDTPATALDTDASVVRTPSGEVPYDRVVIATGSRPKRLFTVAGDPLPNVRTSTDCRALRERAASAASAVVVGTGFIGLEVAATLCRAGLDVATVGFYPLPLDRSIGPVIAQMLRDLHLENGVAMHAGCTVASVEEKDGQFRVHLSSGVELEADMALAGIGAQPNVEWLEGSGVEVGDGIPVDAWGRTNVPGVLAAGDVAAFDNALAGGQMRIEHWTSAVEQGRQVALGILDAATPAFASVPYFWTDQFGCKIQTYGRRRPDDELHVVEGSLADRDFVAVHGGSDGAFTAVTACGRPAAVRPYRALLQSSATLADALAVTGSQVLASNR